MSDLASTRSLIVVSLILAVLAVPLAVAAMRYRLTGVRPSRSYGAHLMLLCTISFGARLVSGNFPSPVDIVRTLGFTVALWGIAVALSEWFNGRLRHGSKRA